MSERCAFTGSDLFPSQIVNIQLNRIRSNSRATIVWSIPREWNRCLSSALKRNASRCKRSSNATCWKLEYLTDSTITQVVSCKYRKWVCCFWLKSCSSERCALTGSNLLGSCRLIMLSDRIFSNGRATIVWNIPSEWYICCSRNLKRYDSWCRRNSGFSGSSVNCPALLVPTTTVLCLYLKRVICL